MAGTIGRPAGPISPVTLGVVRRMTPEFPLVNLALVLPAELNPKMLEFDLCIDRLAAHIGDRVLISEPIGASDGIEHVPAPVVLLHVAKRCANSTLRRDR